jgi:hypothetical protein
MFNTKRNEEDFSQIQKLLATKRMEMPSQSYFNGVLHEFHQRQRAMSVQPRNSFITRLVAQWESICETLIPRPSLRYAYAVAGLAVLLAVGLNESWNAGSQEAPTLSLQTEQPENKGFAFAEALAPQQVSTVDQQIDAASIDPVRLDNKHVMPHYVMAQAPTSYDTTMAF